MLTIFLIVLALIWIIFAVTSDLRTREIPNWLNFSLIIFALGARLFYSLFNDDWSFFVQGIIGLTAFFAIANLLYLSRFFAGGDAKLMIALGPIIPFESSFLSNLNLFLNFLFLFFIIRLTYDLISIFYLGLRDSNKVKKEFYKNLKANKKLGYVFTLFGVVFIILGFFERLLFIPGILIFILPYLYFYTKAIENKSLIEKVGSKEITEGDWLYKDVKVGNRIIEANWNGLSKNEISLIRKKHKFVMIKRGIQFGPGFLIIFLIFIYLYFNGIDLWNSLWQP